MKDILINLYNSQIEGKLVRETESTYILSDVVITGIKGEQRTFEGYSVPKAMTLGVTIKDKEWGKPYFASTQND